MAPCPVGPTSFLEFNPAFPGKLLAVTQGVGFCGISNANAASDLVTRLGPTSWVHSVPDGQYAALSSTGGIIEVWEFNHGEPIDAKPIKLLGPHGFIRLSSGGGRLPAQLIESPRAATTVISGPGRWSPLSRRTKSRTRGGSYRATKRSFSISYKTRFAWKNGVRISSMISAWIVLAIYVYLKLTHNSRCCFCQKCVESLQVAA